MPHAPEPTKAYHAQRAANRAATNAATPAETPIRGHVEVRQEYEVLGRHAISGVKRGGTVMLPVGPQTDALIEAGHIRLKPVEKKPVEKSEPVKSASKKGTDNG